MATQLNLSGLSTILNTISTIPGGLSLFGGHLSQSQEVAAIQVLDNMAANPTMAPAMLPELTSIQNIPGTVLNDVNAAISNIANQQMFQQSILAAKNSLVEAVSSSLASKLGL